MRDRKLNKQSFFSAVKSTGKSAEGADQYAKIRGKKDGSGGNVMEFKVDARDVSFSSGTYEFYAEDELVQDPYDYVWKNPKHVVQQQKQNSEYVDPVEQKLNYKCKREDSPDGTNKCPDNENGKEIKEPKTKKVQLAILGKKLSDVTGAEIVKLDGLQPRDVSTVLNTIKEENQYGEIKLKRIDNTQGGVKSAAMAFTPVNGAFELHLPVKYLKSERERIVEDDADTLIEHMKKTIEHNETEVEKLTSTTKRMNWRGTIAKQKEILRDLIERKESGKPYQPVLVSYHFKGDDRTKASTLHEIGHYRWYAELNDNDKNKLTETFKNISEDKYFPSKLSKQDNEEWIAEQYVMLRMGRECHPTIRDVFGKLKSKQNARGKCPKDSYEPGTFKCDPADSDAKEESPKSIPNRGVTISALTDRNASLFRPPQPKFNEDSKYAKSLNNYIIQQDKLYNTVKLSLEYNSKFNKKFDELRRKFGFDPENPDDLFREMENEKYVAAHEKLKEIYSKGQEKYEKEREYYRNEINKAYAQMATDFTQENLKETVESEGSITHGKKITPCTIYRFDKMQIVKDKNSNTDINDLYFKVQSMPSPLRDRVGNIEVLEYSNPDDKFWSEKTGDLTFTSAGCAGTSKISFFNQGNIDDHILAHEVAHLLDNNEGNYGNAEIGTDPEKYYYMSDDEDETSRANIKFSYGYGDAEITNDEPTWADAMNEDNKMPQKYDLKGYVSKYAALQGTTYTGENAYQSRREDFAESVAMYMTNHGHFAKQFPNRAKFIDKYLKSELDDIDSKITDRVKKVVKK